MTSCPSRRRELAELVDGALGTRETERLQAHLVSCPGCRAETMSLRQVRARLRGAEPDPIASAALTDRLVSIAGSDAARPLYARPFDTQGPRTLPSRRRRNRRVAVGAVTLTWLLLAGLVGVGWAAAPPTETRALDPGPLVREEFAAVLGAGPLANPAVTAARATDFAEQKTDEVIEPAGPTAHLTTTGARERLERAVAAPGLTSFEGRQVVQVRHLAGFWVAEADVEVRPGRSTQVTFPGRTGPQRSASLPESSPGGLALEAYRLRTGDGPVVAGRDSVIVEASRGGQPAARWWLDDETSVLLWQETFDRTGQVTLSAGFRTLTIGPMGAPLSLPPRLAPRGSAATLALTSTDVLQSQGWLCRRQVAGLGLMAVRRDDHDPMVHTVYGDGVVTLSVIEQKGALAGAPAGFVWAPEHDAYRSLGVTTMYSWQSGDRVFTVATDGPAEVAERAVAELPHATPVLRTRVDRVLDGWRSVLGMGS